MSPISIQSWTSHDLTVLDLRALFAALDEEDMMEVEFRAHLIRQRAQEERALGLANRAKGIVACCRLRAGPVSVRRAAYRLANAVKAGF